MKLKKCLEIGLECGMGTVGDSLYNINLHSMNIFKYNKINEEINELIREAKELFEKTNFTRDSPTKTVLDWINIEDCGIDETKLNI